MADDRKKVDKGVSRNIRICGVAVVKVRRQVNGPRMWTNYEKKAPKKAKELSDSDEWIVVFHIAAPWAETKERKRSGMIAAFVAMETSPKLGSRPALEKARRFIRNPFAAAQ